jgi:bacteriorhodopsin
LDGQSVIDTRDNKPTQKSKQRGNLDSKHVDCGQWPVWFWIYYCVLGLLAGVGLRYITDMIRAPKQKRTINKTN